MDKTPIEDPDERERRVDAESRERIDQLFHNVETFAKKTWIAIGLVVLFLATALAVEGYLLGQNGNRAEEAKRLNATTRLLAQKNDETIKDIQRERRKNLMASCVRSNEARDFFITLIPADYPPLQDPKIARALKKVDCDKFVTESLKDSVPNGK